MSNNIERFFSALSIEGTSGLVRRAWLCSACREPAVVGEALCPSCRDADISERRRAQLADAWASLPERFRNADGWKWDPRRGEVVSGAKHLDSNVLLTGRAGAGKTAMACAVLARKLRAAESPTASAGEVFAAAASRYVTDFALTQAAIAHPLGQGDPPLYREALRAPLLVLDELGYDLADRRHLAKDLVFARYDACRRTIITTGQTQDAVRAAWGAGAARRIWDESAVIALGRAPREIT